MMVPFGVELKSEQKMDKMIDILLNLQNYVPIIASSYQVFSPQGTSVHEIDTSKVTKILFGKSLYFLLNMILLHTQ